MKTGFTLIGLLIVIIIIAILIAVTIYLTPASTIMAHTKANQVAQNFRAIRTAVESYIEIEKNKPADLEDLVEKKYLSFSPDGFSINFENADENGKYIVQIIYSKSNVDLKKVLEILPDVREKTEGAEKQLVYSFSTQKSW
ncbi:prepilin-type cleavage/methylation domain-containing protein [Fervidobacterium sp.]